MVTVTNAAGCDNTDAIVITTNPQPILNLGANINSCVGNTITLDAGNVGATYLWSNGSVSQTIQVTQSGNYSVAVTNALGCTSRDTINVNFNAVPVVNLGVDKAICSNEPITLDAGNPGATYLWSTGATTQTIVAANVGTYSVTVTNANGCSTSDQIVITYKATPSAVITTSAVNLLNVQFNAVVAAGQTYNWNFGDPTSASNVSSLANPVHTFSAAGQYFVTLTVTNVASGCTATNTDTITVQAVGVNNINANLFKLQAAPNPFSGSTKLAFNLPIAAQVSMEVFDLLGRNIATIIEKENLTAGAHTVSYVNEDHSNAAGIYLVKLTVNGTTAIIRINDIATK
jgi:PKD repeat protein